MNELPWFERNLKFGYAPEMLPYFLVRLEGTFVRMQQMIAGLTDAQLSYKPNGKWSIKENIGHLAEVDAITTKRIDEMLAGSPVLSPAVFEPLNYTPWVIDEVLNLFQQNRNGSIKKYLQLIPAELRKASMHPRLKVAITPVDLAWFDAEHDDHHLVKIKSICEKLEHS
ncbi:MAG: DinB family protein [Cyclobacteriaceae bacterium]|nr:DinB family protein [Cyclobacteriaceae bacterium]